MKKTILFFVSILLVVSLHAGISVDVKVFTGYSIKHIKATPVVGKYTIFNSDKKIAEVLKNETVEFTIMGTYGVQIRKNKQDLGIFSMVSVSGSGLINEVTLKPVKPDVPERTYHDDIRLSVVNGAFLIVNHVNIENYVAGVIQAEGGGSIKDNEFYIVQAICCRTYALSNIRKHSREGFNLCDSVHCQHYMGVCTNSEILMAVYQTMGDVIVDKDGRMISAAFHANSGGQTCNSEDVWVIPTSYLKSVEDAYSLEMPDARWERTIKTQDWLAYLSDRHGYPVDNPAKRAAALNFKTDKRQAYFPDSIRLTTIRADMGFRSAFFSISESGENVVFSGRGYGHGVGLSQQGAIRMAQLGFSHKDIIQFYYKDVDVVNYEQLIIKNN